MSLLKYSLDALWIPLIGEEGDVQVGFHNLLFTEVFLQLEGGEDFLHLSLRGDLVIAGQVLDDLLGDGGAALYTGGTSKVSKGGTDGSQPVHAVMLQKTFVLCCDGNIDQHLRYLVIADPLAVLS